MTCKCGKESPDNVTVDKFEKLKNATLEFLEVDPADYDGEDLMDVFKNILDDYGIEIEKKYELKFS